MNMPLVYTTLLSALLSNSPAKASANELEPSFAQRSGTIDTLCEVVGDANAARRRPSKPAAAQKPFTGNDISRTQRGSGIRNRVEGDKLHLYFSTNDWRLFRNDLDDLNGYIKTMPAGSTFIVEGNTDYRGSQESNNQLGTNRANGVAGIIRNYSGRPRVTVVSYGEKFAQPDGTPVRRLGIDRKVTIVPNKGVITSGLQALPSDFYLLDQSSSMNGADETGENKWEQVQNYNFRTGSKLYTFSTGSRTCGGQLSSEFPLGSTPLFRSLYRMVDQAVPAGKSITVLTDGEDTEGGNVEAIIKRANEKKISISFVGVGLTDQFKSQLEHIQTSTGGGKYFSQR